MTAKHIKKTFQKEPLNCHIAKTPCYRCGHHSSSSWYICSLGKFAAICTLCDIQLNLLVLEFMDVPDRTAIGIDYIQAELAKKSKTPVVKS